MNNTSWEPLSGTSTLLAVHEDPTGYAPAGVGIGNVDQLLVTEDSIQVMDLRVVRVFSRVHPAHSQAPRNRTTWMMGITRFTCMVIAHGCTCAIMIGTLCHYDC
jgi:iron transport multicopper oxidase